MTAPLSQYQTAGEAIAKLVSEYHAKAGDWFKDRDGVLVCGRCFEDAPYKVLYTAIESPLPDLDGDACCNDCGSHPCRFCGNGIVPLGFKYCQEHSHFCPRCDGGGEVAIPEAPAESCPDCNRSGLALCRLCKAKRADRNCSGYCSGCEERIEEAAFRELR